MDWPSILYKNLFPNTSQCILGKQNVIMHSEVSEGVRTQVQVNQQAQKN